MEELFQLIVQAIGTLGFPIAAYLGLFWYINKRDKEHKEEIQLLSTAIDRLSTLIERIDSKLDRGTANV